MVSGSVFYNSGEILTVVLDVFQRIIILSHSWIPFSYFSPLLQICPLLGCWFSPSHTWRITLLSQPRHRHAHLAWHYRSSLSGAVALFQVTTAADREARTKTAHGLFLLVRSTGWTEEQSMGCEGERGLRAEDEKRQMDERRADRTRRQLE